MLTIKDLTNPNLKNKESDLKLPGTMKLRDVSIKSLQNIIHEYINVTNETGTLIGAVKTERLAYLVFKQKESEFMQILDTMDSGIIAIDRDSRVYYVNHAYARILGVNISKILGRYLSIVEPEARLLHVLQTGKSQYIENQLIKSLNTYVNTDMHPLIEEGKIVGAFSIFTDVTDINKLHNEVQRITEVAEEYNQQIQAKKILEKQKIIGESKVYLDCVNKALKVAPTDTMVLLRGENGVGKEIISNLIKDNCKRKNKPFVTVNCSAIPNSLIESELFGYEEGSFTGAAKGGKMGKFQLADGGTLFLDEIGDMPYEMQAKLLRVLQEGEIERVGRQGKISVDVRVIAATNKNLEKMVSEEKFREDLYYRLNVVSIQIPPLRDRGNDVLLLTEYFLKKYCKKYHRDLKIDRKVYQSFMEYSWPGNVRELINVIESAVILCDGSIMTLDDLPDTIKPKEENELQKKDQTKSGYAFGKGTLKEEVERFEKALIFSTIEKSGGDKEKAMQILGLSKRTFYRKIAKNGTKDGE